MTSIMTNGCSYGCAADASRYQFPDERHPERNFFGLQSQFRVRQRCLLVDRDHHAFGQQGTVDRAAMLSVWLLPKPTPHTPVWTASITVVEEIKAKLVAAREPGVDKTKINSELTELKSQLSSIAESASFSGENWLYNSSTTAAGTKEMVASFTRSATGSVSVGTLSFDAATSTLIDTNDASKGQLTKDVTRIAASGRWQRSGLTATYFLIDASSTTAATGSEIKLTANTSNENIEGMISAVDSMLSNLTDSASTLGAANSRISTCRTSFISTCRT